MTIPRHCDIVSDTRKQSVRRLTRTNKVAENGEKNGECSALIIMGDKRQADMER